MTREEAIRLATGLRTDFKCESDTMVDFCNTIIKALSQEPTVEKDPCETCGYAEGSPFCLQYCPYDAERKKEQEPCDDAISREAVKELIKSGVSTDTYDDVEQVCKWIDSLPSVTQKSDEQLYKNGFADGYEQGHKDAEPKSGKWIDGDSICPCCGEDKFKDLDADIWSDWQPKYCPNCGAEMESEDKE